MENLGISINLIIILSVALSVIVLVKFFILCKDIHILKDIFVNKYGMPTQLTDGENKKFKPTKADVEEFKDKVKRYRKENASNNAFIEHLVAEYNEKFDADFNEYID